MPNNTPQIIRNEIVNVGFDVSAETLNWTVILNDDSEIHGECLNTTDGIVNTLHALQQGGYANGSQPIQFDLVAQWMIWPDLV